MMLIVGSLIVCMSVFGGFMLGHGKLLALWQPAELIIIGGAAFGAFVIANSMRVMGQTCTSILALLVPKNGRKKHLQLLGLLFAIGAFVRKRGLLALEDEIDAPHQSALFSEYPLVLKNKKLVNFLVDNLRLILSDNQSRFEMEEIMEHEIERVDEEIEKPAKALNAIAESLPGYGIVAAVLGIVITMQFIGGDPKYLGIKVAAALVGTFLGVLLAYGFVGPVAHAMSEQNKAELQAYACVKTFILAFISGTAPQMAVEHARRTLYSNVKPEFEELEDYIRSKKTVTDER